MLPSFEYILSFYRFVKMNHSVCREEMDGDGQNGRLIHRSGILDCRRLCLRPSMFSVNVCLDCPGTYQWKNNVIQVGRGYPWWADRRIRARFASLLEITRVAFSNSQLVRNHGRWKEQTLVEGKEGRKEEAVRFWRSMGWNVWDGSMTAATVLAKRDALDNPIY